MDTSRRIYLTQPEGFAIPCRENEVCRLHKCIYNLKQASGVWGQIFTEFIKQQDFTRRARRIPAFFSTKESGKIVFIIRVVDGILVSNKKQAIENFKTVLRENFQLRSYPLERFVGITNVRDRAQRRMHLSQVDYTRQIVGKFHIATCFPKSVPTVPGALGCSILHLIILIFLCDARIVNPLVVRR